MEGGHERRAFAAGGDVAAAEVAHDVQARQFGHQGRIVELQRPALFGAVPDRLPVNAHGGHVLAADVGFVEQFVDAGHVELAQFDAGLAHAVDFIVAGQAERQELFLDRLGKLDVVMAGQTRSHTGKINGNGIDAVQTGSGH